MRNAQIVKLIIKRCKNSRFFGYMSDKYRDTACRIGGDEFLVVLSQIESDKDITQLCERLVSSIKQPINYGSHNLFVTVSIGASVYPSHGDGSENLRRSADQAMYQAKKSGKNNYHISIA